MRARVLKSIDLDSYVRLAQVVGMVVGQLQYIQLARQGGNDISAVRWTHLSQFDFTYSTSSQELET